MAGARAKIGSWNWFNVAVFLILSALMTISLLSKIFQYYSFQISDLDTGIYSNVVWNFVNGNWFYSGVLNRNHLGEHFSPIILVFAPFFIFDPSPLWLLGGQGLAIGTTYVLLYFVGRKIFFEAKINFAKQLALGFAIWAFFYPPLTSALLSEFHPSTLATPLLAAAVLAMLHNRDRVLWPLVAFLLLSKENAPLAVFGLGCYAWLVLSRPRLGIALAAVACVSAVLIMGVVMPLSRSDHWEHYSRLGPFASLRFKSIYLIQLVKGLAYLPLASWRSLVCAAPLVSLNLSVTFYPQFSSRFHYDDFASVFLLVAAMHGTVVVFRVIGSAFNWRAIATFISMALIALLLTEPGASAIFSQGPWFSHEERQVHRKSAVYRALAVLLLPEPAPPSAISYLASIFPGDMERLLYQELAVYRSLPFEVGIAAQSELGPYLSARPRYVPIYARSSTEGRSLKPGDMVLVTPIRSFDPLAQAALERDPTLTRVYLSPVLRVYKVNP